MGGTNTYTGTTTVTGGMLSFGKLASLYNRYRMEQRGKLPANAAELKEFCKKIKPEVLKELGINNLDAAFVSPTGLTRGRQQGVERYKHRYPGPEAMGALALEVVEMRTAWGTEVSLLGDAVPSRIHSVSVVARWTLRRAGQPDASGLTLVVLRPRRGGWEIVQDASM
jgi:hypothetical protein